VTIGAEPAFGLHHSPFQVAVHADAQSDHRNKAQEKDSCTGRTDDRIHDTQHADPHKAAAITTHKAGIISSHVTKAATSSRDIAADVYRRRTRSAITDHPPAGALTAHT
jgi:hypothetical protein